MFHHPFARPRDFFRRQNYLLTFAMPFRILKTKKAVADHLPILQKRLPNSCMIYNVVQLYLNSHFTSNVHPVFFVHENVAEENTIGEIKLVFLAILYRSTCIDQVVLLSVPQLPIPSLPMLTLMDSLESVISWTEGVTFAALDLGFSPSLHELCNRKGQVYNYDACAQFVMSDMNIMKPSSESPRVVVKQLNPQDAPKVIEPWKWSSAWTNTLGFISDSIESVGSGGVYVNEELVSWVVGTTSGTINALFTMESFRRNGHGKLAMKECCYALCNKGLIPNVQISLMQEGSSWNLMETMRWMRVQDVEWIVFHPSRISYTIL